MDEIILSKENQRRLKQLGFRTETFNLLMNQWIDRYCLKYDNPKNLT